MNLTWLIVKKDIERFRVHLASMIAIIVVLIAIILFFSSPMMSSLNPKELQLLSSLSAPSLLVRFQKFAYQYLFPASAIVLVTGVLAEVILIIYVVTNVLKEDAPDGDRAFWRTRPISGARMFAAKAIFIVITMLPVQLGLQVFVALLASTTPRGNFYATLGTSMASEMIWVTIAIYIGLSPQVSSTKRNSTWLLYFLSLVANIIYWVYIGGRLSNAHIYRNFMQEMRMFYFVWIFFAVSAAWLLYRYRSRRLVLLAFTTGLLIANSAMTYFYMKL